MQGRLTEITSRALGFEADEAQQYLQSRLPFEIAREDIERAVRRVEGWISALQLLAASSATSVEFSEFVDQLEHGNQNIFDYFDELVGNDLSEEQRRFLMRTSILDRFNAGMVMRVMDDADGQALLSSLLSMGLFITPVDNSALWFRPSAILGLSAPFAHLHHSREPERPQSTGRRRLARTGPCGGGCQTRHCCGRSRANYPRALHPRAQILYRRSVSPASTLPGHAATGNHRRGSHADSARRGLPRGSTSLMKSKTGSQQRKPV